VDSSRSGGQSGVAPESDGGLGSGLVLPVETGETGRCASLGEWLERRALEFQLPDG
jgi:hypothetical protein